jgi:uracil-DNA glycosylase
MMRRIEIVPAFDAWQAAARRLLRDGVTPAEVTRVEGSGGQAPGFVPAVARVPKKFLDLARQVASSSDTGRWAVLYEAVWRLVHESPDLLEQAGDPLRRRLNALAAQARREAQQTDVEEMLKLEREGGAKAT